MRVENWSSVTQEEVKNLRNLKEIYLYSSVMCVGFYINTNWSEHHTIHRREEFG